MHFHLIVQLKGFQFQLLGNILDPIGSSLPKLSSVSIEVKVSKQSTPLSMGCQAQGHPIPNFRYDIKLFIYFLEPVGSSLPKFSSTSNSLGNFDIDEQSTYNLNCPAQGSPAPNFRWDNFLFLFLDPVGSSGPKFSTSADSATFTIPSKIAHSLTCPAQGSPMPQYRYFLRCFIQSAYCRACWLFDAKILLFFWVFILHS